MTLNISGPLLVFGGPYSNLEALKAIREVANVRNIPADHVLCTGDVVAYCADAKACADEIRDWGIAVVMGNCEESLGEGANDCGCGFEEGTGCDLLSKQWFDHASKQLDADDCSWMANLPRSIDLRFTPFKMRAIHGGVDQINKFVFASQKDVIADELRMADVDIVLAGHCGLPFAKQVGDQYWINAGVIGMPANDGGAHTWYCLIEPDERGLDVSFHQLSYDFAMTADKMRAQGLAEGYASALSSGLWPSLDVLPEVEKKNQGQGLSLSRLRINP
ncbi:metallophosphoesterase family protein [Terasakiella sp. A23]|uniref:metallophosphoesterase family protein n=1 Tax=Terasakiella sp. FCG-A23 TaxID=3080561 RepID=UPI002954D24C|nr:metallophosphoesterase family protein [Terasakiella sp. A23]MDV7340621.1 metallophosphoesterase family protein [Terasakiella sp. A23]